MERYDSYKDSGVDWIGEIPSHWFFVGTNKVYNDLGTGTTPTSDNTEYYSDNGYHWITTTDLNEGIMYDTLSKITEKSVEDYPNLRLYPSGSIYISMYGGRIGKLGVSTFDSYCNQSVCVLPKNDEIIVKFYYYWFLGFQEFVKGMGRGGGQPNINKDMIKSFPTVKIPLPEQQQIVSFLDNKTSLIDSLIEKTQRKIELLKEKRTSLINEVVTKGLNPNVEMKDSGEEWIGEIPIGWSKTKMKHVVDIFGRIGYRGYTTEDIVDEGEGVITISPSNIFDDKFSTDNSTYLSWEKYHESPEIQIFTNDIILVKTGSTIGKTSIIPEDVPEMTINPQLVVLKNIKIFPKYLYYQTVCKFIKESFEIEQTGSSTPTISQEKVKDFPILEPPINEQNEIVSYLDEQTQLIDKTVSIEEKRIELLKEYRQSLISEVVTGKRKVV